MNFDGNAISSHVVISTELIKRLLTRVSYRERDETPIAYMAKEIKDMAEFGRIVRYHRKRARLSRAALSDLAGIGSTVIYELEHGKSTVQFNVVQSVMRTLNMRLLVDGPLLDEYFDRSNETSGSSSER